MKFFISYCDRDGLDSAKTVAAVLEKHQHEAWFFERDKSTGILRAVDIAKHIRYWCDKVLYICTTGSISSEGQWKEIGQWDATSKQILVIPVDGAEVPDVIDPWIYTKVSSKTFQTDIESFVKDRLSVVIKEHNDWLRDIKNKDQIIKTPIEVKQPAKTNQILSIALKLNNSQKNLRQDRIDLFYTCAQKAYIDSSLISNIVTLIQTDQNIIDTFTNVFLYSSFDLLKFNADDYLWDFAFKELGREIASGEKRELVKIIQSNIEKQPVIFNENTDDVSIIEKELYRLHSISKIPTVILAPPSTLKSFVHYYSNGRGKIDFTRENNSAATIFTDEFGKLLVYLLGGGVLTNTLILMNPSDVQWKVLVESKTKNRLIKGIGIGENSAKATFIVGTTVKCEITTPVGIAVIPIER